jgi:hypothetical protein
MPERGFNGSLCRLIPTPAAFDSGFNITFYLCDCHGHNPSTELAAEKPESHFSIMYKQPHYLCQKL